MNSYEVVMIIFLVNYYLLFKNWLISKALCYLWLFYWVCKPAYLVPVIASQDKFRRVVSGRASGIKMVGAPISQDRVAVHPDCWSACVIFILLQKIQKMANKDMTFGYHCVGAPHAYTNRRWGNPAGMQHNHFLGCRVVLVMG